MAENRVEFELAMKDEATKVMNNFKANVNTQSKAVQDAFNGMRGATANSTNALMNFNRVIQDAPYGIMGVANNLNPLLESFQRLTKESGSVKNAIMAMISGIASPAGIGIALAAVSSLAVVFSDKLIPKLDETKRKTKEAEEAMKSYADMLNRVIASMKVMDVEMEKSRRKVFEEELKMVQGRLKIYRELESQIKSGAKEIIISEEQAARVGIHADELLRFTKQQLADEIKRLSDRAVELNTNLNSLGMTIEATPLTGFQDTIATLSTKTLELSNNLKKVREQLNEMKMPKLNISDIAVNLNVALTQAEKTAVRLIATLGSGFSAVSYQVGNEMYDAFERSFKGANSLFEIFMANVAASIAELAAKEAAKTIVKSVANLIVPGSGDLINAVFGSFHNGGTVPKAHNGAYINAPASREFPIIVRGGETVRTEGQERDLQNGRAGRSVSVTVNVNGNGLVPRDVQQAVIAGMRESGLTVDKYFVNNRSKVVLA